MFKLQAIRKSDADCRQAKKPSIKCYNCGKQGHMAKECRSSTQKPKCGHCNKMGHTDDKCWQKHGGRPSGGEGQPSTQSSFATSFNQDPFGVSFMGADNRRRDEAMRDSVLKSRGQRADAVIWHDRRFRMYRIHAEGQRAVFGSGQVWWATRIAADRGSRANEQRSSGWTIVPGERDT